MTSIFSFDSFLPYILVGIRAISFSIFSPFFSETTISPRIRLYWVVVLSLVLSPVTPINLPQDPSLPTMAGYVFHEIFIGAVLGVCLRFVFYALEFAGAIISQGMSLTNVSFYSPNVGGQVSIPSQIFLLAGTMLFLSLDFHHHFIRIFKESYELFPINFSNYSATSSFLLESLNMLFKLGLKLSTPLVVFGFLISFSLGILNRLIPQVQIFMMSQPLQIGFGFFVFLYVIQELFVVFVNDYETFLLKWVR